jgi:hypothetical protein
MNPSGIRPSSESGYSLRQVQPGLYSVEGAYRGNYEFFKGRPVSAMIIRETASATIIRGNSVDALDVVDDKPSGRRSIQRG